MKSAVHLLKLLFGILLAVVLVLGPTVLIVLAVFFFIHLLLTSQFIAAMLELLAFAVIWLGYAILRK